MFENTFVSTTTSFFGENTTSKEEGKQDDFVYDFFLILVSSLIIVTNLMVICAVLLVVFKKKHYYLTIHQRNSYIFIFNLAIADISVGIISLTMLSMHAISNISARTYTVCVLEISLIIAPCAASVFSMTAISLDRYVSIMHPLRYDYTMKKKKMLLIICVIWALSMLLGFAPLMGWNNGPYDFELHHQACSFLLIMPASYIIFGLLGIFLPQFALMIYVYTKIFRVSRRHCKQMENRQIKKPCNLCKNQSCEVNMFREKTDEKKVLTTQSCPVSPVMPRIDTGYVEKQPAFFPTRTVRFSISPEETDSLRCIRKRSMPIVSLYGNNNNRIIHKKPPACVPNQSNPYLKNLTVPSYVSKPPSGRKISENGKPHALKRSISYSSGISMHSLASQIKTRFQEATHPSRTTKSSLKALRTIMLVIVFFFIMWSPFLITSCVQLICGDSCHLHDIVGTYLLLLGLGNSAVNPIVYTYTNKELKTQICSPCAKRKRRKIIAKSSTEGKRSTAEISDHQLGFSNQNSRLTNSCNGRTSQSSVRYETLMSEQKDLGLLSVDDFLRDNQPVKDCHLPNMCLEN